MILFRIIIFIAVIYFAYKFAIWLPKALSSSMDCPRCQGKGHWYGVRHREDCKDCNGTGRVMKIK